MICLKLAWRNLTGSGLQTWLNILVLSASYAVIIGIQGLLDGWNLRARRDVIDQEIGGGQYWHGDYDPDDRFTWAEAHGPIPKELDEIVQQGGGVPILVTQATLYPGGRMQGVALKGIPPQQHVLNLSTKRLFGSGEDI